MSSKNSRNKIGRGGKRGPDDLSKNTGGSKPTAEPSKVPEKVEDDNSRIIKIFNIPSGSTEKTIHQDFSRFGQIVTTKILLDDFGKPADKALVLFKDPESAIIAEKQCKEKSFILLSNTMPVSVERLHMVQKNQFSREIKISERTGAWFAESGSIEDTIGALWKEQYEIYRTCIKTWEEKLKSEAEKYSAHLNYSLQSQKEMDKERIDLEKAKQKLENERKSLKKYETLLLEQEQKLYDQENKIKLEKKQMKLTMEDMENKLRLLEAEKQKVTDEKINALSSELSQEDKLISEKQLLVDLETLAANL